ncbi:MAG: hypothetical protein IJT94_09200 [Oscillibacter sp.]|nr:hypothetical protein [Oscillibacter sp.]
MGEFEDTLGRILGDPSAMAQIARLAQSLGGPSEGGGPPPGPPPGDSTLSSVGGGPPSGPSGGDSPPPNPPSVPPPAPAPEQSQGQGGPPVSGPAGLPGLAELSDSPLLRKLIPLLLEGRQNSEARRFLYALRPYLSPRRQENVERALQLARLIRVGRRFLAEGEAVPNGAAGGGTEGV